MGTRGVSSRVALGRRTGVRRRVVLFIGIPHVLLALVPFLGACSSMSGAPGPQAAAAPPGAPQQAADPTASIYPQQSLADLLKGSTETRPSVDPTMGAYPQQPLVGQSAQAGPMPRPPSTYTPAGQSYVAASYSPAVAAPPASDPAVSARPYPSQSLTDFFKGAPATAPQTNVPRPPTTYTPSGQPYTPPGQPGYGAAPAAPPVASASADPGASGTPYPQQTLFDIFTH